MAYPNPIKTTGALSTGGDIFEYFKGALRDNINPNLNPEAWPYYFDPLFVDDSFIWSWTFEPDGVNNDLYLPMNRAKFYRLIDYWSIESDNIPDHFTKAGSVALYTFAEPVSGWTTRQVNDWGKMKSVELALFGNVGNGGSTTSNTLAAFNGQSFRSSVLNWTINDLNYLRYGLIKFDSYGSCHPEDD